jgi:hypothetical protein
MSDFVVTINEAELAAILADFYGKSNDQRPNDFFETTSSVVNTVNVAIAPPLPTVDNLQPTIDFATATVTDSVAKNGVQETPLVVTILETTDDAGELALFIARQKEPAVWFGNIQIIMNGLTDAQRTTINNLDIGSQVSVTKSFPNSTPSTVTQLMALEGISHDITPDRHIVTLYPNPARIYTYFIVGGYTTTTTRTNLMTNPSFEVNTTGWGAGNATIARSTVWSAIGTASLLVTPSSASPDSYADFNTTATALGVQGLTCTFSATINVPVAQSGSLDADEARTVQVFYQRASTGGTFFNVKSSQGATTGTSRLSATVTFPSDTTTVLLRLNNGATNSASNIVYFDAVLLETGSTLLPYFDGTYADTYTGYTLTAQGWSGTANASTSTATWGLTSSFVGSELDDVTKGLG